MTGSAYGAFDVEATFNEVYDMLRRSHGLLHRKLFMGADRRTKVLKNLDKVLTEMRAFKDECLRQR